MKKKRRIRKTLMMTFLLRAFWRLALRKTSSQKIKGVTRDTCYVSSKVFRAYQLEPWRPSEGWVLMPNWCNEKKSGNAFNFVVWIGGQVRTYIFIVSVWIAHHVWWNHSSVGVHVLLHFSKQERAHRLQQKFVIQFGSIARFLHCINNSRFSGLLIIYFSLPPSFFPRPL